ncbi:hypothetical protein [Mesoflavibacter zeaxanthinifaciens]|uniref:hypothetical protein n=1 Tax=Mesoflavibacter zeaxanthinifaciens TaxID=393060 RepID=UPI003A8CD9E4
MKVKKADNKKEQVSKEQVIVVTTRHFEGLFKMKNVKSKPVGTNLKELHFKECNISILNIPVLNNVNGYESAFNDNNDYLEIVNDKTLKSDDDKLTKIKGLSRNAYTEDFIKGKDFDDMISRLPNKNYVNRKYIFQKKINNKLIPVFGYRCKDYDDILKTKTNFITALVMDVASILKKDTLEDFFEKYKLLLILHADDIGSIQTNDEDISNLKNFNSELNNYFDEEKSDNKIYAYSHQNNIFYNIINDKPKITSAENMAQIIEEQIKIKNEYIKYELDLFSGKSEEFEIPIGIRSKLF